MTTTEWIKASIDLLQAIISGLVVGFVVYWLDERRAIRDRRLTDYRIALNWDTSDPKISLRNFDLTKTNLSGRKFIKADLESAIFEKAVMWATNFTDANVRSANFHKTKLVGVKFKKAMVYRGDFTEAMIYRHKNPDFAYIPDFSEAVFIRAKFVRASVQGVNYQNTNLKSADFSHAQVKECDFSHANLTDTRWERAIVENCVWKDVVVDNPENLPMYLLEEIKQQNAGKVPMQNLMKRE